MGIKFRLIVMNFLQYAIWGSWLISLGAYLGGGLQFTGLQIGSFFATMGIASLFMPALMGIIADRWIPAQKLLGICQLISAGFLVAAASQTAYGPLYTCMLMSVMFYMPTIALSNSVAYNALDLAKLDAVKHFPPIRVWGTVGFIAATAEGSLAAMHSQEPDALDNAIRWVRLLWDTPIRTGTRRYYDNFLYAFAFLALAGEYRTW